jgi:protein involved in polysaccharide export with SLBB domain
VRAGSENMRPTVVVRSSAPTQVFVGGEVQKPGVLGYRPGLSLLQAVIEAGGRLPSAELTRVMVLRRVDNVPTMIQRDLSAALPQDMALAPGDVVLLPQTRVASLAEALDQYVFKLFPPLRNSSFGIVYDLRGTTTNTN